VLDPDQHSMDIASEFGFCDAHCRHTLDDSVSGCSLSSSVSGVINQAMESPAPEPERIERPQAFQRLSATMTKHLSVPRSVLVEPEDAYRR
jgi:hypothetical protein